MFNRKIGFLAIGMALCLAIHPQNASAEIFKSSEFLGWERKNQEFYIRTSIGMASLIVGQTDKAQAKCVDDWYVGDETKANDYILDVMRKHPEYHPRGIILAVLEKKCGKFVYKP